MSKKLKLTWVEMLNGWFPRCPRCNNLMALGDFFTCLTGCGYAIRAGRVYDRTKEK